MHSKYDLLRFAKKSDFLSRIVLANRFKNSKFTNPFSLWKIKIKEGSLNKYDGSEMSDD